MRNCEAKASQVAKIVVKVAATRRKLRKLADFCGSNSDQFRKGRRMRYY